jgi:hypothetical protein
MALDAVVLIAFLVLKWQADPVIILIAAFGIAAVFSFEHFFLKQLRDNPPGEGAGNDQHKAHL